MADFNWTITPGTLLLAGNLVTLIIGGRIWFTRSINSGLKLDNTEKLQNIATGIVERQDARIINLEKKIEKDRDRMQESDYELGVVREYLLRDAAWHIQVLAELKLQGGSIDPPPELPSRRREFLPPIGSVIPD